MLELHPIYRSLRVGETTSISIVELTPKFKNRHGRKMYSIGRLELGKRLDWKVNEIRNGDEFVGQIFEDTLFIIKGTPYTYTPIFDYDAPKKNMPDENPVTIKATLGKFDADNYFRPQVTLGCKIEIYDEYKVLITDTIEARVGMGTFVADSGSFVVRVNPKNIIIKNVKNYPPYSYKLFNPPPSL